MGRKCSVNNSALDKITPESSYWIGFLFADGTVYEKKNRNPQICLEVSEIDENHIQKFKDFLASDHAIGIVHRNRNPFDNSKPMHRIAISSLRLAERLKNYGMRKHLQHFAIPQLAFSSDFWRGVIDGDGYIGIYKVKERKQLHILEIGLYGGLRLLDQFKNFVEYICPNSNIKVHKRADCNCWRIKLSGAKAREIISILYKNSVVALTRKRERALDVLQIERAY